MKYRIQTCIYRTYEVEADGPEEAKERGWLDATALPDEYDTYSVSVEEVA